MNTMPAITVADINDAPQLQKLGEKTFRDAFGRNNKQVDMDKYVTESLSIEKIYEELANEGNKFFLARSNGSLTGYAKVSFSEGTKDPGGQSAMEISRLYVLETQQNRQAGAALLAWCCAYAASRGCKIIWLGVWEHNPRAILFYKRHGFEIFGSHIFRLGNDDQTDLLMKKVI